jgi:hypothetical protein
MLNSEKILFYFKFKLILYFFPHYLKYKLDRLRNPNLKDIFIKLHINLKKV